MSGKKSLVAYYSRGGNTEVAAKMFQKLTGSDLFRIETVRKYPEDYNETTDVAKEELRQDARPKLTDHLDNMDEFGTVYLGYPSWYSTMPMALFTILEEYDFSGKTIAPFCTHEGSGMGRSESDIKKLCPHAILLKGLPIVGSRVQSAEKDIAAWIREVGQID